MERYVILYRSKDDWKVFHAYGLKVFIPREELRASVANAISVWGRENVRCLREFSFSMEALENAIVFEDESPVE